ncbi:hypothetical protein [Nonomuraea aridisoli]|uniref:Uncharacterized protein n=1 Tax=Nonomuraea aridisoli TaxID=2070368 RepID=A0A2W2DT95_9ACTN|nr:hypothetical protein [Nonomuraea aridisoli]PZG04320.1 hypothetical protein C1J01_44775 [Nonomuraea aridisoli]
MLDEFRLYAAQFPHYNRHTLANSMRLWAQDPYATRVQGEKWWHGEGRQLREDAVPLWIESLYQGNPREERENPQTGETEEVVRRTRAMIGTAVYDVSQTVPKEDVTCTLCRTVGPEECAATCPVYQPEAGHIPSRGAVLMEAFNQLKLVGGLNIEEILGQLGDDPYRDGDRVEGVNSVVISVPKPGGKGTKALRVHVSHDDKGRTRYAIVPVGVFWIGLDSMEYDRSAYRGSRPDYLRVQYGDDPAPGESRYEYDRGSKPRPGAPVVNTITLAGDGTYDAHDTSADGRNGPYVGRPGYYNTRSVTDKAERATRAIVHQLTQHWLKQPSLDELRAAHDRHHAPHARPTTTTRPGSCASGSSSSPPSWPSRRRPPSHKPPSSSSRRRKPRRRPSRPRSNHHGGGRPAAAPHQGEP